MSAALPSSEDKPLLGELSEQLQAQILVALDTAYRKEARKDNKLKPERVVWCATPYLSTTTQLRLFLVWTVAIVTPVFPLVEFLEHGGWISLVWAVTCVFIFVPRMSRASREVYVLTDRRAFVSLRTLHCSIQTTEVNLLDIYSARLLPVGDGSTATLELYGRSTRQLGFSSLVRVRFEQVRGVEKLCNVLDALLPRDVCQVG